MNHRTITFKLAGMAAAAGFLMSCAHALPQQSSGIAPPTLWQRLGQKDGHSRKDAADVVIADDKARVEHAWWMHFNDETLNQLVRQAVAGNKTLGIARARIAEARANLAFGRASQKPQIDGVVDASRGNLGGATDEKTRNSFEADLRATWEIDIFGRNLPRLAQAEAIMQNEEAAAQAVLVGLLAELGRDYFDLRNYQRQIAITAKNLENQRKTVALIQSQLKGALASDFDVQRAQAQASTTEATLPALKTAYAAALNRISVLVGDVPGGQDAILEAVTELQPLDQQVIVAAPATVLANRPDVKAAERAFAASISGKQAAQKLYFPEISLLTFFGAQQTTTVSAFPWSAGLTLVQPVLDFGRIRTQINAADARQQQAFLNYQHTVLTALEDMEGALTSYKNEVERNSLLRKSVEQNSKAADFAQQQFQSGFTGLLDVLVAQGNLLAAESALAQSDMALRKDLINIYAASGGGWKVEASAPAAASVPVSDSGTQKP